MSAHRGSPAKKDANQPEIVEALEKIGCSVLDLSGVGGGCPDLLVSFRGRLLLMEVKNPKARGKLNERQKKWHSDWRGDVRVVNSVGEAIHVIEHYLEAAT